MRPNKVISEDEWLVRRAVIQTACNRRGQLIISSFGRGFSP